MPPLAAFPAPSRPHGKAHPGLRFAPCERVRKAFTLIELLVVISIVVLLIGILLPALASARTAAKVVIDLSNLRQVGTGLRLYISDNEQAFPKHSSSKTGPWSGFVNRPRWPDYIFPYIQNTEAFLNPLLSQRELEDNFQKPFAHDTSIGYGGYGYNFQYLGNSRFSPVFHAKAGANVVMPSDTVVVGDTAGARNGNPAANPGDGAKAVYVLDPPLSSARRAHPDGRAYYPGSSVEESNGNAETYLWRSFPAERLGTDPAFSFADGHASSVPMATIDDHNGDGLKDNGYWNGHGDALRF